MKGYGYLGNDVRVWDNEYCRYNITMFIQNFAFTFNHAEVERAEDTGCPVGLQISLFSAKMKRDAAAF
jgi:hypothetical protein